MVFHHPPTNKSNENGSWITSASVHCWFWVVWKSKTFQMWPMETEPNDNELTFFFGKKTCETAPKFFFLVVSLNVRSFIVYNFVGKIRNALCVSNLLWKITALLSGEEKNIAFHFNVLGVVNLMGDVDAVPNMKFLVNQKKMPPNGVGAEMMWLHGSSL